MTMRFKRAAFVGLLLSGFWILSVNAETTVTQELEVGLQDVNINNPEAKFEEYKDIPQGIVFPHYELNLDAPNYEMSFDARNVAQEDQSFNLDYSRNGKLKFNAGWDQTPHRWSNTSRTLYNETSSGVYELPDDIQADLQTSTATAYWWSKMPGYLEGAHEQDLMIRRDKLTAGLGGALTDSIGLSFNFSKEKKFGNQLTPLALGRSYLTELARSVDETVYDSVLALTYNNKSTTLGLSYGLNLFENDKEAITWDSSKRLTDRFVTGTTHASPGTASSRGRAAMSPDNLAHHARLNAGFDLSPHARLTADVTYTRMEQNEKLLAYSINSSMTYTAGSLSKQADDPANLPSETAQTVMNLWVQDYQLANRFDAVSFGVKVRSEQLGNNSEEITFAGHTVLDQSWTATPEETTRFSYRKNVLTGYFDWNLLRPLTLGVDYTKDNVDRTHREYEETSEATWVGRVDYRPLSWAQIRGRYNHANRDAKDFEIDHYMSSTSTFAENPGIRRYDIAERVRNAGDLKIDAWLGPFSMTLNGALGHDKYKAGEDNLSNPLAPVSAANQNKQYGLLENRIASAGVDMGYDISQGVGSFSTYYQYSQVRGVQRQNQNTGATGAQNAPDDYTLNSNDRYDVVGVGFDSAPILKTTFHLGYDLSYSRGAMEYSELGSAVAAKESVPETVSSKQDYSVKGEYQATKSVSVSLGYLFELYNVKDFAQDNVPLASGQAAGQTNVMLGDSSLDYKAHVFTLLAKYKF